MSYDLERKWIDQKVRGLVLEDGEDTIVLYHDGQPWKERCDAGRIAILPGEGVISSVGGPKLKTEIPGVLSIQFLTDGGKGTGKARRIAQKIVDAFFDVKQQIGVSNGADPVYIDFSYNGSVPYISDISSDAPYLRTTVNAPFVRTELKQRQAA